MKRFFGVAIVLCLGAFYLLQSGASVGTVVPDSEAAIVVGTEATDCESSRFLRKGTETMSARREK